MQSELFISQEVSPTAVRREHIAVNLYDPYLTRLFDMMEPDPDGARRILNPYGRKIVAEVYDETSDMFVYQYGEVESLLVDEDGYRYIIGPLA